MRKCELCEKSYIKKTTRKLLRGNYNPTARGKQKANLQKKRLPDGRRVLVCANCIKTRSKL